MRIGRIYVNGSYKNDKHIADLLDRLKIIKETYVDWNDTWEIVAEGMLFPDIARYPDDHIPSYILIMDSENNGDITYRVEPR